MDEQERRQRKAQIAFELRAAGQNRAARRELARASCGKCGAPRPCRCGRRGVSPRR